MGETSQGTSIVIVFFMLAQDKLLATLRYERQA
jgi:hypothetical protein